ncbi:MAG: hypothetical protein U0103_19770 [Candidatus Obscuribacterales bacterium]|nr:MAG: hypothetical protein EKK48_08460 [Candidatus Melainabacteria bacterium]
MVALPPRLQSLLTMKKLWAEYSALLVRTRISSSLAESQAPPTSATSKSAIAARARHIGSRWNAEARMIQFEFEFAAVEAERHRVAKELHDESLPLLARLIRSVQAQTGGTPNLGLPGSAASNVAESNAAASSAAASSCAALVDEVHQSISAFRDLLGELHPVDLEELGLLPAIDNICKRYMRRCGRLILFFEQAEECQLSRLQQLCVYRAIQALLKMFVESENDMLMIQYQRINDQSVITIRCADKLVSSAQWITAERADFDAFEAWCSLAGASVQLDSLGARDQFPNDLVISISEEASPVMASEEFDVDELSQARLSELDIILAHAKDEWARLINRDRALFESLAVGAERKNISDEIDRFILPRLENIVLLAGNLGDQLVVQDVTGRMELIAAGVSAVMSDLHPRLLTEAGLIPSIQALVDRFRRASLIEAIVYSNLQRDRIEISDEAKFAIYRVTQEALNNIEKHSGATHTTVLVEERAGSLIVSIEDNGRGIRDTRNTLSRGLKNIRERASAIGAEVNWTSAMSFPTGTKVSICIQLLSG